jgi:ketosteroid isomerase-like protein
MRRWLVRLLVERVYKALGKGDPKPALRMFATNARFCFAGSHSWALDTTEPAARRSWFERFAALGPDLRCTDVVVGGPPWRMSVCVVFDDALRDNSGDVVYRNHGVQYLRLRWGRVVLDEINLDTQRVADYDSSTTRPHTE